jgi:anti-sigma factor RsiW
MDGEKGSFSEALRAYAEEARRKLGEHPAVEVLAAYHEGRLPEAEQERVADHLALCTACRELLLDLAKGADLGPAEGTQPLSDRDVAAAWEGVRGRLEEEPGAKPASRAEPLRPPGPTAREPAASPRTEPRRAPERTAPPRRRPLALAASLLLGVGLFWGASALYRSWQQANTVLVELSPEEERTRGSEGSATVPADAKRFALILNLPEGEPVVPYEAEVARGEQVVLRPPPVDRGDGTLRLDLTRDDLPPGDYRVRLFGGAGSARAEVATYEFEVEGP